MARWTPRESVGYASNTQLGLVHPDLVTIDGNLVLGAAPNGLAGDDLAGTELGVNRRHVSS